MTDTTIEQVITESLRRDCDKDSAYYLCKRICGALNIDPNTWVDEWVWRTDGGKTVVTDLHKRLEAALTEIGVAEATDDSADIEQMAVTHLFGLRDYALELKKQLS